MKSITSPDTRRNGRSVPVLVDGLFQTIPVGAIPKSQVNHAHGVTRDGIQVNSAKWAKYGDSVVLMSESGHALSITAPEAEILAVQLTQSFGYDVTAPKSA